jgi:hypothetical protein
MSVGLRSLHVAAACLRRGEEQREVMRRFQDISRSTGWRIDFIKQHLMTVWNWPDSDKAYMATARPEMPIPPIQPGPNPVIYSGGHRQNPVPVQPGQYGDGMPPQYRQGFAPLQYPPSTQPPGYSPGPPRPYGR